MLFPVGQFITGPKDMGLFILSTAFCLKGWQMVARLDMYTFRTDLAVTFLFALLAGSYCAPVSQGKIPIPMVAIRISAGLLAVLLVVMLRRRSDRLEERTI